MGDSSVNLDYDDRGKLVRIRKMIEAKELLFEYDSEKEKVIHIHTTNHAGGRIYSADDLWVPKCRFIAALKQATAIFKQTKSHENKPQSSIHQITSPFFKS